MAIDGKYYYGSRMPGETKTTERKIDIPGAVDGLLLVFGRLDGIFNNPEINSELFRDAYLQGVAGLEELRLLSEELHARDKVLELNPTPAFKHDFGIYSAMRFERIYHLPGNVSTVGDFSIQLELPQFAEAIARDSELTVMNAITGAKEYGAVFSDVDIEAKESKIQRLREQTVAQGLGDRSMRHLLDL